MNATVGHQPFLTTLADHSRVSHFADHFIEHGILLLLMQSFYIGCYGDTESR